MRLKFLFSLLTTIVWQTDIVATLMGGPALVLCGTLKSKEMKRNDQCPVE